MREITYDREAAVEYAKSWAFLRNPNYLNFDNYGGDCTNFVSQCIFAGCKAMNYTPIYGWYYNSSYDRTASWTGVEYLYNFLVNNTGIVPRGIDTSRENIQPGDIIQLGDRNNHFYHSPIVVAINQYEIFIAAHTFDAYMKPLSSYNYSNIRYIHILDNLKKNTT